MNDKPLRLTSTGDQNTLGSSATLSAAVGRPVESESQGTGGPSKCRTPAPAAAGLMRLRAYLLGHPPHTNAHHQHGPPTRPPTSYFKKTQKMPASRTEAERTPIFSLQRKIREVRSHSTHMIFEQPTQSPRFQQALFDALYWFGPLNHCYHCPIQVRH